MMPADADTVASRTNVPSVKPRWRGVSHHYGFFVALALGAFAVGLAPFGIATFAAVLYSVGLVAMFGVSALYHRGTWSTAQAARMLKLDHTTIFLMIAGTCTAVALLAIDGVFGVVVLAAVWSITAFGIVVEWTPWRAPQGYVTTVYLMLGWVGALGVVGLWSSTGITGVALIAAGGVLYTVGAIVHATHRPDPWPTVFGYHEIFHAFVIGGALLHYIALTALVFPLGA